MDIGRPRSDVVVCDVRMPGSMSTNSSHIGMGHSLVG